MQRILTGVSAGIVLTLASATTGWAEPEATAPPQSEVQQPQQASDLPKAAQTADPLQAQPQTPVLRPIPPDADGLTPDPGPSKPIGPAKEGAPPEYLNPDPNPLQFPTKPEEVEVKGIQPITLDQAIELAERNNREIQRLRLQLDRSRAALRETLAENYPNLDLQTTVSNSRTAGNEISVQRQSLLGFDSDDGSTSTLSGNLALSYDLFTSGGRPARIAAAQQQLRSDELALEVTREQLRLDVASDYYNLQEADEAVRINQAAVRNNEISLRDAQARERAGLGTRFDVLRAEVQLANSQQDLRNAIAQQIVRRRQLSQRLSIPQSITVASADPVAPAGIWPLSLEQSIVLAYKNRAELEQQLVQRELSRAQRRAALSALGPRISLSAQYEFLDVFADDISIADGYTLSAVLRWRLFDGGAARAQAAQQEINMQIAEVRFAESRDQVRFQVEQAYENLVSNKENIDTNTKAVEQAREALRLARLRFQAGVGTQTDVINAETDLTRAEGNLATAILNYNRSLASLRRAVSNVTTVPVPTPTN